MTATHLRVSLAGLLQHCVAALCTLPHVQRRGDDELCHA